MAFSSIVLAVKAQTKDFQKGLKSARKKIAKFTASIKQVAARVAKFGAIVAGVAAGAMTILVKRAFDSIDATGKLATRLEVTTEALQGFRHAAELSGSSSAAIDKALETMIRRLGEARLGLGEAKDALEAMGIGLSDLEGLDAAEQFRLLADKIAKTGDATDKAVLAYKLFGRQGQELLNTISLGADGLREAEEEARRFGVTFSRIDAKQIENANDAMYRLRQFTSGLANQIAIQLAPFVEALANRLINVGLEGETAGERVGGAFNFIVKAIAKAVEKVYELSAGFYETIAAIKMLGSTAVGILPGTTAAGFRAALDEEIAADIAKAAGLRVSGRKAGEGVLDFVSKVMSDALKRASLAVPGALPFGDVPLGGTEKPKGLGRSLKNAFKSLLQDPNTEVGSGAASVLLRGQQIGGKRSGVIATSGVEKKLDVLARFAELSLDEQKNIYAAVSGFGAIGVV